jgi:acylphosphatase
MKRITERLYFSGRVQGVGFRAATQRLARGSGVDGFVQNLPDGRVEVVATAEASSIDRLVIRLKGLFAGGILEIQRLPEVAVEEFSGFHIRR